MIGSAILRLLVKKMQLRRDIANSGNKAIRVNQCIHSQTRYDYRNYLIVVTIIGLTTRCLFCFEIVPQNLFGNDNNYTGPFLIYIGTLGFSLAFSTLSNNVMLVPLLPHAITGSIQGFRLGIIYIIKATGALIVGSLWHQTYEWLWYANGLFGLTSLILVMIVACCETSGKFNLGNVH